MQTLQSQQKLIQVEQALSKNDYFSRSPLPGFADAVVFKLLLENQRYPHKKMYPSFYHWYIVMKQFSLKSLDEWIKEKRYIQSQSERCMMLISQIFYKSGHYPLRLKKRNSSLQISPSKSKLSQSKLQPIDLNSPLKIASKAQYCMIVQVRITEDLQQMFNRFYKLKIKIKQLKYRKKQMSVFVRFLTQKQNIDAIKKEIQAWNDVRHVICKLYCPETPQAREKKRIMRTVSIR